MSVKKTVAIIGAGGDMGSALAKALVNSNYRLLLMSRNKSRVEKLSANLKKETRTAEVAVIECAKEACWEADVILLAIPFSAEKEVVERIKEVATQKVIIDVSNPLNDSYNDLITKPGISAAEELQKMLPNSKVVKAFNTIFASDFTQTIKQGKQIKTFVAGDDQEAIQTVVEMAVTMGFNPVLCENLAAARELEQMVPQLIELKKEQNYNNIIGHNMHRYAPITFKLVIR